MEVDCGYDYPTFNKLLKETKPWFLQLDGKKRLNVIKKLVKNPLYKESDVYILCLNEYQKSSYHRPPERKNPPVIRFRMKERKPIKPITEIKNTVKKSEKRMGRKRPRENDEDWEFGVEEGKSREKKKKRVVNPVPLQERQKRDLPEEFKDRIRALNGSDVTMVIEKRLFASDVSENNGRLSLPSSQIDMRFLSEEDKVFLGARQKGNQVSRMKSRIIGEGGMEHGICLSKWDMTKSSSKKSEVYNLVSGWKDVLEAHNLRQGMLVQLWSFRVEGNLWFALVNV